MKFEKSKDGFIFYVALTAPLSKEELTAYPLNCTLMHVLKERLEDDFKKLKKRLLKEGDSLIEELKKDADSKTPDKA
jgi:hypothetical protein